MSKKQYIHYGASEFHHIAPIKNREMFVKPLGGLWASPVNSPRGWKEWCAQANYETGGFAESFTFTLTDDAKIIHIYSVRQLEELPKAKLPKELEKLNLDAMYVMLDFEALEKEYDGIELHMSEEKYEPGQDYIGGGLYFKLYGWDCDSILIFHDEVVILESE